MGDKATSSRFIETVAGFGLRALEVRPASELGLDDQVGTTALMVRPLRIAGRALSGCNPRVETTRRCPARSDGVSGARDLPQPLGPTDGSGAVPQVERRRGGQVRNAGSTLATFWADHGFGQCNRPDLNRKVAKARGNAKEREREFIEVIWLHRAVHQSASWNEKTIFYLSFS